MGGCLEWGWGEEVMSRGFGLLGCWSRMGIIGLVMVGL